MARATKAELEAAKMNGKSNSAGIPFILSWEKVLDDPPFWNLTIEGSAEILRIKQIKDIYDYKRFSQQCMAQLNRVFMPMKQMDWLPMLDKAMASITEKLPDESRLDEFLELLETYLTNRQRGLKRDDLLRGVPWEDEENKQYFFKLTKFERFLDREKMKDVDRDDIIMWLRKLGGEPQPLTINGKRGRYWSMPSDIVQKMPTLTLPDMPEKPI